MIEEGRLPAMEEIEAVEEVRERGEPTGEVHPVAALFPMMTDDELDDLAEDIRANGLVSPIVLDANGMLIDGRNRLIGCQRAGIEPRYTALNGHDPVAFIISSNVARRHLSKGQQAMAVARAGAIFNITRSAAGANVSRQGVSHAKVVLDYAPDLSDAVISGASTLNEAYEEARKRKLTAEGRESSLARLQSEAPDLASLVQEERLSLSEALGALEKRKKEERDNIRATSQNLNTALTYLDPGDINPREAARTFLAADPAVLGGDWDFSAERARRSAAVLLEYAGLKEEKENG